MSNNELPEPGWSGRIHKTRGGELINIFHCNSCGPVGCVKATSLGGDFPTECIDETKRLKGLFAAVGNNGNGKIKKVAS